MKIMFVNLHWFVKFSFYLYHTLFVIIFCNWYMRFALLRVHQWSYNTFVFDVFLIVNIPQFYLARKGWKFTLACYFITSYRELQIQKKIITLYFLQITYTKANLIFSAANIQLSAELMFFISSLFCKCINFIYFFILPFGIFKKIIKIYYREYSVSFFK